MRSIRQTLWSSAARYWRLLASVAVRSSAWAAAVTWASCTRSAAAVRAAPWSMFPVSMFPPSFRPYVYVMPIGPGLSWE